MHILTINIKKVNKKKNGASYKKDKPQRFFLLYILKKLKNA